jgi:type VII secretion protein EccB
MPSRQDQLHSYQFMVQRVVAALVMRETDPSQSPFRRVAGATLAGALVAAIALGAVGAYGIIAGGGSERWRDTSAVIVEKESGARFVYRDGKLHPVLNYASGLLIVGASRPRTVLVSRGSIEGVPRGTPLGVPDLPDSLPAAGRLVGAPWTVCSGPVAEDGRSVIRSALFVGRGAEGGRPLGESALLARSGHSTYLIYHNRRHRIRDTTTVLAALGWAHQQPVIVTAALLNTLDVGTTLELIDVPGRGKESSVGADTKIGQVFVSELQGGGRQYAVALADGIASISQVQADILLGDRATRDLIGQTEPTRLAQGDFAAARKLPAIDIAGGTAPAATPPLAAAGGAVCTSTADGTGVTEVRAQAGIPDVGPAVRTGARTTTGAVLADYVFVEPGRGALVQTAAGPGAPGGTLSLVTDLGRRYAVSSPDVLGMLGFGGVHPVRLPAGVVSLTPAGNALDPAEARGPAVVQ